MKKLSKKKYPKKTDALKKIAKKFGKKGSEVFVQEKRNHWLLGFKVTNKKASMGGSFFEFLKAFRLKNPEMEYQEAQKEASKRFKKQRVQA